MICRGTQRACQRDPVLGSTRQEPRRDVDLVHEDRDGPVEENPAAPNSTRPPRYPTVATHQLLQDISRQPPMQSKTWCICQEDPEVCSSNNFGEVQNLDSAWIGLTKQEGTHLSYAWLGHNSASSG